jgi:hypothetical protein
MPSDLVQERQEKGANKGKANAPKHAMFRLQTNVKVSVSRNSNSKNVQQVHQHNAGRNTVTWALMYRTKTLKRSLLNQHLTVITEPLTPLSHLEL